MLLKVSGWNYVYVNLVLHYFYQSTYTVYTYTLYSPFSSVQWTIPCSYSSVQIDVLLHPYKQCMLLSLEFDGNSGFSITCISPIWLPYQLSNGWSNHIHADAQPNCFYLTIYRASTVWSQKNSQTSSSVINFWSFLLRLHVHGCVR